MMQIFSSLVPIVSLHHGYLPTNHANFLDLHVFPDASRLQIPQSRNTALLDLDPENPPVSQTGLDLDPEDHSDPQRPHIISRFSLPQTVHSLTITIFLP